MPRGGRKMKGGDPTPVDLTKYNITEETTEDGQTKICVSVPKPEPPAVNEIQEGNNETNPSAPAVNEIQEGNDETTPTVEKDSKDPKGGKRRRGGKTAKKGGKSAKKGGKTGGTRKRGGRKGGKK